MAVQDIHKLYKTIGKTDKDQHSSVLEYEPTNFAQLKYLHACDKPTIQPREWQVKNVLKHCFTSEQMEVYCTWKDGSSPSWIAFSSLALHDPIPILKYAKSKHLLNQPHFKSLAYYCIEDTYSHMHRVFLAQTGKNAPKITFGEIVPRGLKEAYLLDKKNSNNDWGNAVDTELKQLHNYSTFKCLTEGKRYPRATKGFHITLYLILNLT